MGKLIVIEGTDGSGKSTQFRLLSEHLEKDAVAFKHLVFPRYSEESSALIRMYLGGQFGKKPTDVNAYAASSFYAADRYASFKMDWGDWYYNGGLVLSDRYTTSNAVHQASKVPEQERESYLHWLYDFEYAKLGLPKPDLVIYLDMPVEVSQKLMKNRYCGDDSKKDLHEKNVDFLLHCRETAMFTAKKLGWKIISCSENGIPKSITDINTAIESLINSVI